VHAWDSEPPTPEGQAEFHQVETALRENRCAKKLFAILASELSAESLVRLLRWIIFWDMQTKTAGKAKMTERLAKTTGKSMRTLKYLPKKVDAMAHEIESVNNSALFDPHLMSRPSDRLPAELRLYARVVQRRISEMEDYLRGCKKGWSDQGDEALRFLVQAVKEKTGMSQFQEIADLLTETARALGMSSEFDPDALKMRLHRKNFPSQAAS
jgi:hypothetical protein